MVLAKFWLASSAGSAAEINSGFDFTAAADARTADGLKLKVAPNPGFHFNLDAPNKVKPGPETKAVAPSVKKESELTFAVPSDSVGKPMNLEVYVCDDANTYCKPELAAVTIATDMKVAMVRPSKPSSAGETGAKAAPLTEAPPEKHGFLLNGFEEGLARGKRLGKPVLVDFSAIWCPACLQLEHDVLDTPEFAKASKDFVKVRIDLDWEGSQALKTRYHVKDIPTLVLVNADGEELARLHGYRPKRVMLGEISRLTKAKLVPMKELKARADKGDRISKDLVGVAAYDSLDYANAVEYLKGTKREKERRLIAEGHLLADQKKNDALIAKLRELTAEYPKSVDTSDRWLRIAKLEKEAGRTKEMQDAAERSMKGADALLAKGAKLALSIDSSRDDAELEPGEIWVTKASALDLLGRGNEAKAAWGKAADETKKSVRSPTDKGRLLALAYYMNKAGRETSEVDAVYADLAKRFPDEYTFHFKRADLYFKKGDMATARPFAEKAVAVAYGANLASSALLLAKIFKAENKTVEASKLAKQTLAKLGEPTDGASALAQRLKELKTYEQ